MSKNSAPCDIVAVLERPEILNDTDGTDLFKNYIHVDSAIEWSQDNSKPVVAYKKTSRSAIEYTQLAKEIIEYAHRKERN